MKISMNLIKSYAKDSIIIFVITFILLEISLQVIHWSKYRNYQFEVYKEIYSDEREKPYLFSHKNNIKVKLEKGIYEYTISTNTDGLREKKDYSFLDESIIILGDSIVEGTSVEDHETMDEILENNIDIPVLNFGLSSSSTIQQYYYLKEKYKKSYNANLIILGFCLNDFEQNLFRRYFDPSKGNWKLYDYLNKDGDIQENNKNIIIEQQNSVTTKFKKYLLNIKTISTIYHLSKNSRFRIGLTDTDYEIPEQQLKNTIKYIKEIKKFSKSINADFLVLVFPYEDQLYIEYKKGGRVQDQLISALNKNDINYLDLYDPFVDFVRKNADIKLFHDNVHPYKYGHQLTAQVIKDYLLNNF